MCLLRLSIDVVVAVGLESTGKGALLCSAVHLVDGAHCCHCVSVVEGVKFYAWEANEVGCFVLDRL